MQQVPGNVAGFPGAQNPMSADGKAPRTSLDAVLQEVHPSALGGYFTAETSVVSESHRKRSLATGLRDSTVCFSDFVFHDSGLIAIANRKQFL